MTPERKAEIEALASRMDGIISWPDAAPAIRELLAEVDRADASGYARGRAEAVETIADIASDSLFSPEQRLQRIVETFFPLSQKDTRHAG